MESVPGIDVVRTSAWLERHVAGARPPFRFRLVTGGHSNLTYEFADAAGARRVLRRPPLRQVLATAHDMGREHRIISALGRTRVPVPATLGFCADETVTGVPFYVMEYVDGVIVHDLDHARGLLDRDGRRTAGLSLVDVLAELHAVDPDAIGLGDLGRKQDYIARQLRRWSTQYEQSKTRDIPEIDRVRDRLAASIPDQGPAAIVHGDYKLGNLIHAPSGEVVAVLDWEICTLGDPLADLGYVLVTWTGDPGDPDDPDDPGDGAADPLRRPASLADGFPPASELVERYAARSGRDLSNIDFYVAFSAWKLACILEGVYSRYQAGALGDPPPEARRFAGMAVRYAQRAQAYLGLA